MGGSESSTHCLKSHPHLRYYSGRNQTRGGERWEGMLKWRTRSSGGTLGSVVAFSFSFLKCHLTLDFVAASSAFRSIIIWWNFSPTKIPNIINVSNVNLLHGKRCET